MIVRLNGEKDRNQVENLTPLTLIKDSPVPTLLLPGEFPR